MIFSELIIILTEIERFVDFTIAVPTTTDDSYSVVCVIEYAGSMASVLSSDVIV